MNSLNSTIIEGKVTAKAEASKADNGINFIRITLEVENFGEKESFEVQASGNLADLIESHVKIGQECRVVGRLKLVKWFNTEISRPCSKVVIAAEHLEISK